MPQTLDVNPHQRVELDSRDLNAILAYIARIRSLTIVFDHEGKPVGLEPRREQLKALVNAVRALRRAPNSPPAERAGAPSSDSVPRDFVHKERALPELYGNHLIIPKDWQPAPATAEWALHYLQSAGVGFDMAWLVAEFVSYWRSCEKPRANWQQAFKNNILTKHGRGGSLAPAPSREGGQNGAHGAGDSGRVYDRSAQLRRQRLDDFDAEARDLARREPAGSGADRPPPDGVVGPDD